MYRIFFIDHRICIVIYDIGRFRISYTLLWYDPWFQSMSLTYNNLNYYCDPLRSPHPVPERSSLDSL